MLRMIGTLALLLALLTLHGAHAADWIRINSGNALTSAPVSVVKTGHGHVCYAVRDEQRGMLMGRFNIDTKAWEMFSDGAWSATAAPTSITNTLANSEHLPLFAHPDLPHGLLGMLEWSFSLTYATQGVDVHANGGNVLFDGTRWTQWRDGASYSPYFMNKLAPAWWTANNNRFAFDPAARMGIYIAAVGDSPDYLTASKFLLDDPAQKWRLWTNGGWSANNAPGANNAVFDQTYRPPTALVSLGNSRFLGILNNLTAVRYVDTPTPTWAWWDGTIWRSGAGNNFASLAPGAMPQRVKLIATGNGNASVFFLSNNELREIRYQALSENWSPNTVIVPASASNGEHTAVLAPDGVLWLYYASGSNIYLKRRAAGSSIWSAAEQIHSLPNATFSKLTATFAGADKPMLFVTQNLVPPVSFVLSSPDTFSYWSGEQGQPPLQSPAVQVPDARQMVLTGQIEQRTPYGLYEGDYACGPIAIDRDGYIYAPDPGTCTVSVRHTSETNWRNTKGWGYYWDHLHFPGGVAVDNRHNKVYVATNLYNGGAYGVMTYGGVKVFDLARRADNLGYQGSPSPQHFNRWYVAQRFGSFSFPADVSVDEARGRLYVTNASENKIEVYDIENLVSVTGPAAQFQRATLGSLDATGDAMIAALIARGDMAWVVNPADGRLIWLSRNINSVMDYLLTFPLPPNYNANSFFHNLQTSYKNRHELPVRLAPIGAEGAANGQFRFPQGTDVDPQGNLYVADAHNHRIQKFDANGNFVRSWGMLGTGNGQFINPFGVAADPVYNLIYVTDPAARRVQVFDRNGNFLLGWNAFLPGVTADGTGKVYFSGRNTPGSTAPWIYTWQIVNPSVDNNHDGIPDSMQLLLPPNQPPTAAMAFTVSSEGHPADVTFTSAESFDPDGEPIVAWEWSAALPPENVMTVLSTQPTYTLHSDTPLNATMYLRVRDARQAWSMPVARFFSVLNRAPIAMLQATPDRGLTPLTVNFTSNGTYDPDGNTVTYRWSADHDIGEFSTGPTAQYTFTRTGSYGVTLRVTDQYGRFHSVGIIIRVAETNQPPIVNAGPDQTITFPATASLSGTASDDGIFYGTLRTTWSQVSGPGTTVFARATALSTTATFSAPGVYVLRLTGDDGITTTSDDLTVTVNPIVNQPPVVNAGPDQTITLPAAAALNGSVSDDGFPEPLFIFWGKVSGPGTVVFTNPQAPRTNATFSAPGTYVLRLNARDGELLSRDDVTIIVQAVAASTQPPDPVVTEPPVAEPPPPPHAPADAAPKTPAALFQLRGTLSAGKKHTTCQLTGTLSGLPAGTAAGAVVTVRVGEFACVFTLDQKGRGKNSRGSFTLRNSGSSKKSKPALAAFATTFKSTDPWRGTAQEIPVSVSINGSECSLTANVTSAAPNSRKLTFGN